MLLYHYYNMARHRIQLFSLKISIFYTFFLDPFIIPSGFLYFICACTDIYHLKVSCFYHTLFHKNLGASNNAFWNNSIYQSICCSLGEFNCCSLLLTCQGNIAMFCTYRTICLISPKMKLGKLFENLKASVKTTDSYFCNTDGKF